MFTLDTVIVQTFFVLDQNSSQGFVTLGLMKILIIIGSFTYMNMSVLSKSDDLTSKNRKDLSE